MGTVTLSYQNVLYSYMLGLRIVSYTAAAPFYSSTNAAKMDMEDLMPFNLPFQTDKDDFKNPGFIESLTAVIGHHEYDSATEQFLSSEVTEANKDFTQLHTEYVTKPESMEKKKQGLSETVDEGVAADANALAARDIKDMTDIGEQIDIRETVRRSKRNSRATTRRIDVCNPCGGSKPAEDSSMFSGLVLSTNLTINQSDNSDGSKYYQSIYTEAAEARKENDALMKKYVDKRLGWHHNKSDVKIRHLHRRMKLIQDNETIFTIPNRTGEEVKLSDFLQEMHDRLALGLLHLQHSHEDEIGHSKVVNGHFVNHFRNLTETHLSSLLCWFRQLEWSRNIQDSQCNISHQNVTTLFKDEGNSRSSRFYRDYVLLKFIDETLQSVQKTFSCLQLENGSHNHRWFDCMQA